MGRRALSRIDLNLDLSRHLHTLERLSHPFSVDALGLSPGPLEIEVGSGKGLFLAAASAAIAAHNFVGVEVARKYATFAAARLARAHRSNALVIHGDAVRFFHEHLPDACAAAVHVYFPDPWWKKRHKRRRVMQEPLLRDIERALQSGGALHFWTDVEEYYQVTLELIRDVTQLQGPLPVDERPATHDLDYRTHFERRMRLQAVPVYRAEFRRG
jgi:tRNA (guanine-N7-)-methyltransferase